MSQARSKQLVRILQKNTDFPARTRPNSIGWQGKAKALLDANGILKNTLLRGNKRKLPSNL